MRTLATATALGAMIAMGAPAIADDKAPSKGEIELAELLEGRVAGQPTSCIATFRNRNLEIIDETALVYERGDTIWVSKPAHPRSLDDDDILVIERFGSQLCKYDVRRTLDRSTGMFNGVVFLGDFVPYRKADS